MRGGRLRSMWSFLVLVWVLVCLSRVGWLVSMFFCGGCLWLCLLFDRVNGLLCGFLSVVLGHFLFHDGELM